MSELRKQIEKKGYKGIRQQNPLEQRMNLINFDEPMIEVSVVLGLLDGYDIYPKGERVCIPRKKLEEALQTFEEEIADHKHEIAEKSGLFSVDYEDVFVAFVGFKKELFKEKK